LVPTRDRTIAEQSKNYRYSTAHQVVIAADTRLVAVVGRPLPGNRHDSRGWEESGAKAAVGTTMTIADGGYQGTGLVIPHRREKGSDLPAWKEEHNRSHKRIRARVEHTFARMKSWKILRDCGLKGDGVHLAMLGIADCTTSSSPDRQRPSCGSRAHPHQLEDHLRDNLQSETKEFFDGCGGHNRTLFDLGRVLIEQDVGRVSPDGLHYFRAERVAAEGESPPFHHSALRGAGEQRIGQRKGHAVRRVGHGFFEPVCQRLEQDLLILQRLARAIRGQVEENAQGRLRMLVQGPFVVAAHGPQDVEHAAQLVQVDGYCRQKDMALEDRTEVSSHERPSGASAVTASSSRAARPVPTWSEHH
jgi:hypothetical protein